MEWLFKFPTMNDDALRALKKVIEETADEWAFLVKVLGME